MFQKPNITKPSTSFIYYNNNVIIYIYVSILKHTWMGGEVPKLLLIINGITYVADCS